MSASDALRVPVRGKAFRHYFEFYDNTGALIAGGVTAPDTEISKDGAAFADATNEFTEIGTSGCGYVDFTAAEFTGADAVTIKATCTNANARPYVRTLQFGVDGGNPDLGILKGGALSGTHTTTTSDLGPNAPTYDITNRLLVIPEKGIAVVITAYNTGTGVATHAALASALVDGDRWLLFATPAQAAGGGGLDAAGVRAAIGLAAANLDTQLDALPTNAELASAVSPLATSAGVTSAVAPLATTAGLASAVAPLATAANLTAVKAKTDQLAFTVGGQLDVNALSWGGTAVGSVFVRANLLQVNTQGIGASKPYNTAT